ncbi:MAG: hypothetical protein WC282_01065 [Bacilli bacterium]|jgi:hypothetical protein
MEMLPTIDKKRYQKNIFFYRREKIISLVVFAVIEAILLAFTIMGFTIFPRLVAGFALTHLLVLPIIFLHNFRFVMELRYFGIKDSFSLGALALHLLTLLGIEGCLIFTAFVFMEQAPTWMGASGLAVLMALVLLLIIERKTFGEVKLHIDFDRGLYKDNIVKFK